MNFRILSTSPTFGYYASEPVEYLKEHDCEVNLVPQEEKISEEELIQNIAECDALIVGVEKITKQVIQASRKLRIIAKHGVGVDNIDTEAASNRGIVVTNTPGTNSDAVAEFTVGLILAAARSIPFADRYVRKGDWPRIVGTQINGKALGIIGLGQIGKRVVKGVSGFNMKILAYDVVKDKAFAKKWRVTYLPLEKVLAKSDFVCIHLPLTTSTRRMIGEKELNLMKKTAFLINASRGNIIDEGALYQVLRERKIKGAVLDVFSQEPLRESSLFSLDNVILTPHMGGYTYEALKETGMVCVHNIVNVFRGRCPHFVVNQEIIDKVFEKPGTDM